MPRSYLKDAAQRRRARTGDSYQKTLQTLTRYDAPRPEHPVNSPGIDWAPLHGVEVSLDNGHHQLRGVVLPPDGVRPSGDVLRVAVTHPDETMPAEVTYLDARWWHIDPMPDRVDERFLPSKRRTRGELGLPLYRSDNLPATALATKTMLRQQHRMQPAPDQRPVAEYRSMRDYTDLYAIDDAQALPALSPARHAAWQRARTCARCGQHQATPYPKSDDGARYCDTCRPLAADDWWATHLARAQHLAIDWARDVLADQTAVLAYCEGAPVSRIYVEDLATGETLHDLTAVLTPNQADLRIIWNIADDDPRWADCTPLPDLAEIMNDLAGRRIISSRGGLRPLAQRLITHGALPAPEGGGLEAETWSPTRGDDFGRWCAFWLSEPSSLPAGTLRWSGRFDQAVTLKTKPHRFDRPSSQDLHNQLDHLAQRDRGVLRQMQRGTPTQSYRDEVFSTAAVPGSLVHVYSGTLAELVANKPT